MVGAPIEATIVARRLSRAKRDARDGLGSMI
jgi:hypothetical protein